MCAICGVLAFAGAPDRDVLIRMAGRQKHRGPDGEGTWADGPVGLGHRRLSIIDLEGGHQPMGTEDGRFHVVFNGEIYNFQEIRRALEALGSKFRTRSDTEVILEAYRARGEGCLEEFNGMFAFALWDGPRRRLFLARDRIGKKPLYYAADRRRLIFASEMKALLEDPTVPRDVDPQSLCEYLAFGYIPAPRTILKGVKKLPAGTCLTIEADGRMVERRYWRVPADVDEGLTESACEEQIRAHLDRATRLRLVSDVPLGAFLSGGLDSTAVVSAMASAMDRPVDTFSIRFDEAGLDEGPFARMAAEAFHTSHREHRVKPDALADLAKMVWHADEPFADSTILANYYLARETRKHVTVALAGDGGDELFGGYSKVARGLRGTLPAGARWLAGWLSARLPDDARGKTRLRWAGLDQERRYVEQLLRFTGAKGELHSLGRVLSPDLAPPAHPEHPAALLASTLAGVPPSAGLAQKFLHLDFETYLPEDILMKVDKSSMACALEVRAPFLDYRFVEFAARIPPAMKLRAGEGKAILKSALRGRVPDAIIDRPKQGFDLPLSDWLRGPWNSTVRDLLLGRRCRERGFLNPSQVERIVRGHLDGTRDSTQQVWELLVLEQWCRIFLDGAGPA